MKELLVQGGKDYENQFKCLDTLHINPHSPNALLNYQYDELSKFAKQQDMQIVGATKIISDGKFMDNFSYQFHDYLYS